MPWNFVTEFYTTSHQYQYKVLASVCVSVCLFVCLCVTNGSQVLGRPDLNARLE